MKVALVSSVILAGAGLAAANNNAVEEPTRNVLANIRFGHAVPPRVAVPPKMIMITTTTYTNGGPKPPCGRGRFRAKAIQMANVFRKLVGLEALPEVPVRIHHLHPPAGKEMAHALPFPFIGAGTPTHDFVNLEGIPLDPPSPHVHHMHGHHRHMMHRQSFGVRLNKALNSLGPYEGGAVAFVLGCGIGVLLRMLFVLVIVAFRGFKTRSSTEPEYIQIDAEELILPPPQYTDEKVQAQDEEVQKNLRTLSVV